MSAKPSASNGEGSARNTRGVLLVGSDGVRQAAHARALRAHGLTVDRAASGAQARSLWQPRSHALVIIEFRGAGRDIQEFYGRARAQFAGQKFAFCVPGPPYLTTTPPAAAVKAARIYCAGASAGHGWLTEAAQQIAGLHSTAPAAVHTPLPAAAPPVRQPDAPISFAAAVREAEQVLNLAAEEA